jgi:hypothetical protein
VEKIGRSGFGAPRRTPQRHTAAHLKVHGSIFMIKKNPNENIIFFVEKMYFEKIFSNQQKIGSQTKKTAAKMKI